MLKLPTNKMREWLWVQGPPDLLDGVPDREQISALFNMSRTLNSGSVVLAYIWVVFINMMDLTHTHPWFAYGIFAGYLTLVPLRVWMLHRLMRRPPARLEAAFWPLSLPFLLTTGLLGLAVALSNRDGYGDSVRYLLLAVLAGQHNVVIITVCPLMVLARLYPIFTVGPVLILLLFEPSSELVSICLLLIAMVVHGHFSARRMGRFYWQGVRNRLDLEARTRELHHQTLTDPLTRVGNRRSFEEACRAWAQQGGARQTSMIVVDIDHFKRLNDRYGHPFGDHCLVAVAHALVAALPDSAVHVCRYGGEEFAILLRDTDAGLAHHQALRVHAAIRAIVLESRDGAVHLTCSVGVASGHPAGLEALQALTDAADQAMYDAKTSGRDRVCVAGDGGPMDAWQGSDAAGAVPGLASATASAVRDADGAGADGTLTARAPGQTADSAPGDRVASAQRVHTADTPG